ncbi:MAG: hypothetical protein CL534_19840 [Ahrensia sp.]|nr:hypothetical protein [Ahrensia sp.]
MNTKGCMTCPVCHVPLSMADRQGVEIDFCPNCRGVWLDRGEIDKIIERSATETTPSRREPDQGDFDDRGGYGHGKHRGHSKHGYRRKSWLHELFD